MDNTSGQGKGSAVPEEIKGLSWGGFFWNWIWGLFNQVWLSLLVFVPVVGMAVPFVLLFKGREWAWQSRRWESVQHFNNVQRKWAIAALIFLGISIVLIVVAGMMGGLSGDAPSSSQAQLAPSSK
jgi:phosphate/sulfate permease